MNRLGPTYRLIAINVLNTLLLLLIINLLLGLAFFFKDAYRKQPRESGLFHSDGSPVDNGKRHPGNLNWFDYDATKEIPEAAVADVLDDFYDLGQRGFIYQPWSQFSEPPFAGKRVSVDLDAAGFPVRRTLNPPIQGSGRLINVFVFGGSTTFGYYVADEHTWPTYLAVALNEKAQREGLSLQIQVTNHGHATYFPSQETALCLDVFKSGQRPDLAIFMDGLNWGGGEDSPAYTTQLQRAFYARQHGDAELAREHLRAGLVKWLPMYRLATSIKQRVTGLTSNNGEVELSQVAVDNAAGREAEALQQIVERFRQSTSISKKICEEYGTTVLFFIQPDAFYNYPLGLIKASPSGARWTPNQTQRQQFHAQLAGDRDLIPLDQAFNDFGVQQGKKALVNGIHYNPAFNKFLAEIVAARIDLKKLAAAPQRQPGTPTGMKRQIRFQ